MRGPSFTIWFSHKFPCKFVVFQRNCSFQQSRRTLYSLLAQSLIRPKLIYNFRLSHATLISLLHIYIMIHIIFITFSETNLLTQCQFLFSAYFWHRKKLSENIRGKNRESIPCTLTFRDGHGKPNYTKGHAAKPRGSSLGSHELFILGLRVHNNMISWVGYLSSMLFNTKVSWVV